MAPQADGLLVHGHLIGVDGSLLQDPLRIDGGALKHFLHPGRQLGAVLRHSLRGTLLHLRRIVLNIGQAVADVLRQLPALHGPHGVVSFQRLLCHGAQVRRHRFQILVLLRHRQDVREPGKLLRRHLGLRAADLRQLCQCSGILGRQFPVHRDLGHICGGGIHRDEHIHLAPGDGLLDALLHGILRKAVHPGHLHSAVQIPVVDGADLHGDIPLVPHLSRPTVAGHAFDHADSSYFTGKRLPQMVILPCQSTFPPVLHIFIRYSKK